MDIASISAVEAAGGVMIGVVLAYLEIRSLVRARQTDMVMRIYSTLSSKDYLETWEKVRNRDTVDFNEYRESHSSPAVSTIDDSEIMVYDESLSEQEFNQYRSEIIVNGLPDFRFNRTVKFTLRDVGKLIKKVDDIETFLCNQEVNQFCET